jgi:catechol-2,3-dioxygenase
VTDRISPVDYGISKALYFEDPDGNGVEVYLDTRAENDRRTWEGKTSRSTRMRCSRSPNGSRARTTG